MNNKCEPLFSGFCICLMLDCLQCISLDFVAKGNIVGTDDGFSFLPFLLKPGITSFSFS